MNQDYEAVRQVRSLRSQLKSVAGTASGSLAEAIATLDRRAAVLEGTSGGFGATVVGGEGGTSLVRLGAGLKTLLDAVDSADVAPTPQAIATMRDLESALTAQLANWQQMKSKDVAALNQQLRQAQLPELDPAKVTQ